MALRDRTVIDFTPRRCHPAGIISGGGRSIELTKAAATTNSESRWIISRPLHRARRPDKGQRRLLTEPE